MTLSAPAIVVDITSTEVPETAGACLDCGAPRLGAYCHACGQHHLDGPLRIRTIVRDFLQRKLSLEGGLVRTFVDLTVRPGKLIREYVDGRRQRYTNPVGYMLLGAALHLWVLPLWVNRFRAETLEESAVDPDAAQWLVFTERVQEYPVALTILSCALFIPALRLLVSRSFNVAESAVFALYVFAHAGVLSTLVTPLLLAGGAGTTMIGNFSAILSLGVIAVAADGYFGGRLTVTLRVMCAAVLTAVMLMICLLVVALGLVAASTVTAAP